MSRICTLRVPNKPVGILCDGTKHLYFSQFSFIYAVRRYFVPNFKILRTRANLQDKRLIIWLKKNALDRQTDNKVILKGFCFFFSRYGTLKTKSIICNTSSDYGRNSRKRKLFFISMAVATPATSKYRMLSKCNSNKFIVSTHKTNCISKSAWLEFFSVKPYEVFLFHLHSCLAFRKTMKMSLLCILC